MNYLALNIKHIRTLKGLSQEQFAEDLEVTRSRISSYEENRAIPPVDFLINLSDYFKIPIDVLIKNDLSKAKDSSFIEVGNRRILFPITVDGTNEDLIEIIPIEASAGYLNGYSDPEYIEQLDKIKLPFLKSGTYRAFPIKGDSMIPVKSGTFIVGKFVENFKSIKNGKTYIAITLNDGIVYKRLYKEKDDLSKLLFSSDNKKYEPYLVSIHEILELWEFACNINTQEYEEHELKLSSISTGIKQLGLDLKTLEMSITKKLTPTEYV